MKHCDRHPGWLSTSCLLRFTLESLNRKWKSLLFLQSGRHWQLYMVFFLYAYIFNDNFSKKIHEALIDDDDDEIGLSRNYLIYVRIIMIRITCKIECYAFFKHSNMIIFNGYPNRKKKILHIFLLFVLVIYKEYLLDKIAVEDNILLLYTENIFCHLFIIIHHLYWTISIILIIYNQVCHWN